MGSDVHMIANTSDMIPLVKCGQIGEKKTGSFYFKNSPWTTVVLSDNMKMLENSIVNGFWKSSQEQEAGSAACYSNFERNHAFIGATLALP